MALYQRNNGDNSVTIDKRTSLYERISKRLLSKIAYNTKLNSLRGNRDF